MPRRQLSALEQLDHHDRLVLLGDPGSGKSTFVSFVALCMAGELLGRDDANLALLTSPLPREDRYPRGEDDEPEPQPWTHGSLMPVRVVLRDFAASGLPKKGTKAGARHLLAFLRAELERSSLGEFAPELEAELRDRGGLLLLDGLDEVPEAEARRIQLRDVVRDFAGAFPKCRILVTSRVYAYQSQEWNLGEDFQEATLAPFSAGQIRRFVAAWYQEIARRRGLGPDDAQGKAALLEQAIFANDRLLALAERPLLLTLMASLHAWRGGTLPEKRESLYAAAVDLLLARWESQRVVQGPDGKPIVIQRSLAEWLTVSQDRLRGALDELAFRAHADQETAEGTADVSEGDLLAALARVSSAVEANPALLVEFLRDRAGLLLPRGVGVYTFPHRTFQEYLAACYLTSRDFPREVAHLARTNPGRWREVVLLAGAKAARGSASTVWQLARELAFQDPMAPESSVDDHWGALLAGQALAESVSLQNISASEARQLEELRSWLVTVLRSPYLPAVERVAAGRALALLGDPRDEVTTLGGMHFCRVPPGPFVMGGSFVSPDLPWKKDPPEQQVEIAYEYWIGRYPVTKAQFNEFLDTECHLDERLWRDEADPPAWVFAREMALKARTLTTSGRVGGRSDLANAPATLVSWYHARAYCRWLTERARVEGWLTESWEVRLPTGEEWEKAARGGLDVPHFLDVDCRRLADGLMDPPKEEFLLTENPAPARMFPWGRDQVSEELTNTRELGIGRPTAVGCFPAGASVFGEEIAGNVSEWTQSFFVQSPLEGDEPATPPETQKPGWPMAVRGGDFAGSWWSARCSTSSGDDPIWGHLQTGFRLVVCEVAHRPSGS